MNNLKRTLIVIGILLSGFALSPFIAQSFGKFSWQLFADPYLYQPIPSPTSTATPTPTPTSTATPTPTPTLTETPTTTSDIDGDGVYDVIEDGAPNNGDGNSDGILDSEQSNVASLPSFIGETYVTLFSPDQTTLTNVITIDNPSRQDSPQGFIFPEGFIGFGLEGISEGETISVMVILHSGMKADTYWKYGATPDNPTLHWYEFLYDGETGALINENIITLHFVDGLRGDADLTINGSLVEPGAPGFRSDWRILLPILQK